MADEQAPDVQVDTGGGDAEVNVDGSGQSDRDAQQQGAEQVADRVEASTRVQRGIDGRIEGK